MMASIWDPLGMSSAYMIRTWLIFQSVVRLKKKWDDVIEDLELYERWEEWTSQLSQLSNVVIGRSLLPSQPMEKCDLVGFTDGSGVAYGCVIYLR